MQLRPCTATTRHRCPPPPTRPPRPLPTRAQAAEDSEEEGGEEVDEELEGNEDQELFAAACELLPTLGAALGPDTCAAPLP
jgi:hypothetical protein